MMRILLAAVFLLVIGCVSTWAQEPLVAARELYAAAAYEDALDVLGKMRTAGPEIAASDAELLRAFCLLALRRDDEARSVIEWVVMERPSYLPGEDDASPRVRNAFKDVRRKLLPAVVRQLYASAKDDYEKKSTTSAAAKFSELLTVLSDPDLAHNETLADLRLLSEGFRELSAAAGNVASSATPAIAQSSGADHAGSPAPITGPPRVDDTGASVPAARSVSAGQLPVTPPVTIRQQLPPWSGDPMHTGNVFTGAIDMVVDEQGKVESVSLRKSVHPLYDPLLLAAAKSWTYKPAMRGDQPVKFQKTLVVKLNKS